MIQLALYSTENCHLCEQAGLLIHDFERNGIIAIQIVDITKNSQLLEIYEIRIPVIKRLDTGAELGWPFDQDEVEVFLTS